MNANYRVESESKKNASQELSACFELSLGDTYGLQNSRGKNSNNSDETARQLRVQIHFTLCKCKIRLRKKRWSEGLSKHSVYTKSALYWALGVNSITLLS